MTTMDKAVKEYMKRGVPHYMVKMYGGIDPYTKKQIDITKRGFKTKTEAKAFMLKNKPEYYKKVLLTFQILHLSNSIIIAMKNTLKIEVSKKVL